MKVNNDLLEMYTKLKKKQKEINDKISEIETILKENGSTSTSNYIVTVNSSSRRNLAPLESFLKIYSYNDLREMGLIRTSLETVSKVTEKLGESYLLKDNLINKENCKNCTNSF